jgi:NAD(P)-dependent dehydrogenase (short-subunit alcohol dehydrogenase family)
MGPHHQCAQHRRQGAAACERADLGDARRRHGADQGARRRGAPHGILVNAMVVGFIESDQWVQRAAKTGVPLEDFLANMGKDIPLGRVCTAQEFANMACFLASDAASYITGTAINVDGNRCPVV